MDLKLLAQIADAGTGVVGLFLLGSIILMLIKTIKNSLHSILENHKDERKEWLTKQEDQVEKVSRAIDNLANSINRIK